MKKPAKYKHKDIIFTAHALQRIQERNLTHMKSLEFFYLAKPMKYFPKQYATLLKMKDYIYIANITKTEVKIVTCYKLDPEYYKNHV